MLIRQLFLPAGLMLLVTASAQAGKLAEWTEAAFERHPDRDLAVSERAVGDALNLKARQWLANDPSANLKYQTDAAGSDNGYREWEGGVDLPLWWPGQRDRYRQEAEHSLSLAKAMAAAKKLEAAGEVRLRLWDVALATAKREQTSQSLDTAGELLRDVTRRVAAGELPRSDSLLAEKTLLREEDALQQAENRLRQNLGRFEAYTGVQGNVEAEPEQATTPTELNEQHPMLQLARYQMDKSRAHHERVRGERRIGPNVWLGGKSTRPISGMDYDDSVGVELSIPFGTTAHAAPAQAEAGQELAESTAAYGRMHHELEEALHEAGLEQERTASAYVRAERRKNLAEESLKLSRRAFDLGETDLVRLLQAQADANEARQDLLLSRLQRDRAIALLNQAQGVLPQ